ncbi:MAG: hypothetical protein IJH90_10280 [Mogibacterium sp.]|nr:hypothetical protein [Mogibacterium sp.]
MDVKKRLLALIMAMAMVLTYMPAMAFAEDGGAAATDDPVSAVLPVDVTFSGSLEGIEGTNTITNLYTENFGFYVNYSDGSEVFFEYLTGSYKDSNGVAHAYKGFFRDKDGDYHGDVSPDEADYLQAEVYNDENYDNMVFKTGYNYGVQLLVNVPYIVKEESTGAETVQAQNMFADVGVWCGYEKPVAVHFEPAPGKKLEGFVGYNYIDESFFYGAGNKFVIDTEYLVAVGDDKTEIGTYYPEYRYVKKKLSDGVKEGFYDNGNVEYERLMFDGNMSREVYLKEGVNKVTLPFYAYAPNSDKTVVLQLTVNITATKRYAYANWPIFDYIGKYITQKAFAKKLVVKDSNNKVIPASEYTYTWKKQKNLGWYSIEIRFKNKNKYVDSITADFAIGPKTPKITKVKGGKKKLTVKWKKFTKSQLKKIDGMYIEVAQDRNFTQGYKLIKVSKKALKKGRTKTIKNLAGGKTYYVRMSTFKKIKQGGESYYMSSNDSKIKSGKTKK